MLVRQGLDILETDAFVNRGRFLFEHFCLAHAGDSVKKHYTLREQDSAQHSYLFKDEFRPGSKKYAEFVEGRHEQMVLSATPFCLPFQTANRSTSHPTLFPNTGQNCSLVVKLISSYRHLFHTVKDGNTAATNAYRIKVSNMRLILSVPRLSMEGNRVITNRNLPLLQWNGLYVVQYSQTIVGTTLTEAHFSLQGIPMPAAVLLTLYDPLYFVGEPTSDYTEPIYLPKKLNLKRVKILFGNRSLSYNTANFDVDQPGSDLMRQQLLKMPGTLDNKEMNDQYFAGKANYQLPHYYFSFESDLKNHVNLRPMDYTGNLVPDTMTFSLYGSDQSHLAEGKLLVNLLYNDKPLQYSAKTGTFVQRDLRSLIIGN